MKVTNQTNVMIDWLSISGKSDNFKLKEISQIKLDYGTSVFKEIIELFYKKNRVATVSRKPYSSVLDVKLLIVKFDNYLLYDTDFIKVYSLILRELRIKEEKISRLDIAKDFNYFLNNKHPETFIKDFLSQKIRKLKNSKFSVWGETKTELNYDYLSFGKKSSPVNVYLYNKSKELNQVKNKPWIRKMWIDSKLKPNQNIYRLEFSIKKSGLNFMNKSTGEELNFDIKNIFIQKDINQLYFILMSKFFRFKILTGQKNISREKDVKFFGNEYSDDIKWFDKEPITTNRADKIFLKKLDNLYSELRLEDLELFKALEKLKNVFLDKKHLYRYYDDKIKPQTLEMLERPDYHAKKIKKATFLEYEFNK